MGAFSEEVQAFVGACRVTNYSCAHIIVGECTTFGVNANNMPEVCHNLVTLFKGFLLVVSK